jgi:UDP-glucose 4-epimerase
MIVVIGASGFIGTYLVDELVNNKFKVLATGRNNFGKDYYNSKRIKFVHLDITSKKDFKKLPTKNVKAVILLAALLPANVKGFNNPYNYVKVNIEGTLNVLEYCRKNNIKKIISTTSYADVQKLWEKDYKIKADTRRKYQLCGDHTSYIISKNAATDFILYYNEEYNMLGSIFRLPPVYGYGPHSEIYVDGKYYKSGFQIFLEKALEGKDIEIYGDKNVSRDIVYVRDVAKAFIAAIRSNKAKGVYNIASGESSTLESQVKNIIKIFSPKDKKSKIVYLPNEKNNSMSYAFDISKAKRDFNYNPKCNSFEKLLFAYKKEMESGKFNFLVKGRQKK